MTTKSLLERAYPNRRANLKRAILEAALASFNTHGIEAATIEMIRAAVDTSVGAIYHHFGNKEGLVAALFLAALTDQAGLREEYLSTAESTEDGVRALVYSYVDWVVAQPDWARFMFQARYAVSQGPYATSLSSRNKERNEKLHAWFATSTRAIELRPLASELIPSLIVGPAESYCRAWLSGRVQASPAFHRKAIADAAWLAVGRGMNEG